MSDESNELVQLGTKDVLSGDLIQTVKTIEEAGKSQRKEFRERRLMKREITLNVPIMKNKFPTFKSANTKGQSTSRKRSDELKKHISCSHSDTFLHKPEVGIWRSSLVMKHSVTLHPYLKIQKCVQVTSRSW